MRPRRWSLLVAILTAAAMLSACSGPAGTSRSQATWPPEDRVTIIVPLSPGGGTDTIARKLASLLEARIGKPVVVENRPGGGTVIGLNRLHKAEPDGTTLMLIGSTIASVKAAGQTDLTPSDFTVLGMVNADPPTITVRADSEWDTIDEFVQHVRDHPRKVRVATGNPQGVWDVGAESLRDQSNLPWRTYPTEGGAAPSVTALLGERVEAVTVSYPEVREQVRAGKLKVLAVGNEKRLKSLPDVPTFAEAKLTPDPLTAPRPVLAPPGMDAEMAKEIESDVLAVAKSKEFQGFLEKNAMAPKTLNAEETRKYLDGQVREYEQVFRGDDG